MNTKVQKMETMRDTYYMCYFNSMFGGQGTGTGFRISTNKHVLYTSMLRDFTEILKHCVEECGWNYEIFYIGEINLNELCHINDYYKFNKEILAYSEKYNDIDIGKSKKNLEDIFEKYLFLSESYITILNYDKLYS